MPGAEAGERHHYRHVIRGVDSQPDRIPIGQGSGHVLPGSATIQSSKNARPVNGRGGGGICHIAVGKGDGKGQARVAVELLALIRRQPAVASLMDLKTNERPA